MISISLFLLIVAVYLAINGVVSIVVGAFKVSRKYVLRETYDERDVIGGLIGLGIAMAMVMLS